MQGVHKIKSYAKAKMPSNKWSLSPAGFQKCFYLLGILGKPKRTFATPKQSGYSTFYLKRRWMHRLPELLISYDFFYFPSQASTYEAIFVKKNVFKMKILTC